MKYDIQGMLRGEIERENPRWNVVSGQQVDILLKNATLFDGEAFVDGPVDVFFHRGVITRVSPTGLSAIEETGGVDEKSFIEVDLQGKYVTP